MFGYLFSPSGFRGRRAYWGMSFVTITWMLAAGIYGFHVALSSHYMKPLPVTLPQWFAALELAAVDQRNRLILPLVLFVLGLWSNCANEMKRWHDRGLPGWCFILRFVPFFVPNEGIWSAILSFTESFEEINLGFLGQPKYAGTTSRERMRNLWGALRPVVYYYLLCFALVVLLILYVFIHARPEMEARVRALALAQRQKAAEVTTVATTAPQPAGAFVTPAPGPLDDSALHGTSATDYGRDWVTVGGTRVSGITAVNAAPGGQVALLNADGGSNVAASALPQGFLDIWNITAERLKRANE